MSSESKTFDCVEMKWEIQRKHREELGSLPDQERRRILSERVQADPILGPFLRQVRDSHQGGEHLLRGLGRAAPDVIAPPPPKKPPPSHGPSAAARACRPCRDGRAS